MLLDEPMAGMGPEESARMVALDRRACAPAATVLLIEHDIDAVFRLADRDLGAGRRPRHRQRRARRGAPRRRR